MKKQRSSESENGKDILAIIAGQFLIIALKGDAGALANFRNGYLRHYERLFGAMGETNLVADFVAAGRKFVAIMAGRYSWDKNASVLLIGHVEEICRAWMTEGDSSRAVARLRVVDLWSGLVSCMTPNASLPLSLLDYVMMTILPVVCAGGVRDVYRALTNVMTGKDAVAELDVALESCVKQICCRVDMPQKVENELKLVVLLHMPKNDGAMAANAGLAYKLLQRQYANMEVG